MHQTDSGLDGCEISPIRANRKYQVTPKRLTRRTSRRDQGIDVHSSCSTPSQSPKTGIRNYSSPSSSFPYSQENHPDVVWDYSSPKLPKGSRKKEIKLTIQELLENLNQCQVPECNNNVKSAQYIKLLENWMSNQKKITNIKEVQQKKPVIKKRSRQVVAEMKKFLETIPRLNKDAEKNAASQRDSSVNNQEVGNSNKVLKLNTSSKLFLGGDSTDNDSTDELWGDPDNSFIVKATQELDSVSKIGATNNPIREDLVSTIPETVPSEVMQTRHSCEGRLTLDEYSSLFEELSNVDWDSEMEEWDNGFLIGEDELSEIPEDVLSGTVLSDKVQIVTASTVNCELSIEKPSNILGNIQKGNNPSLSSGKENAVMKEKNAALYNSFEDESFEDESLLCQPDVLSKIDEVENLMSQQPRCTPEEIEKKKDEAIKRRLRNRTKTNYKI